MRTSLQVIDATLALEKIEVDLQVALFNYYSSITDLENAAGNSSNLLKIWYQQELKWKSYKPINLSNFDNYCTYCNNILDKWYK